MRVTRYTDYSLRVLMFLGMTEERRSTIREISEAFDISRNHLMKVVQQLVSEGYVDSVRGVGGGLRLAKSPDRVRIGQVVRAMEPDMGLVECMRPGNTCVITEACRLRGMLTRARQDFLDSLDQHTLAELIGQPERERLSLLLKLEEAITE